MSDSVKAIMDDPKAMRAIRVLQERGYSPSTVEWAMAAEKERHEREEAIRALLSLEA